MQAIYRWVGRQVRRQVLTLLVEETSPLTFLGLKTAGKHAYRTNTVTVFSLPVAFGRHV